LIPKLAFTFSRLLVYFLMPSQQFESYVNEKRKIIDCWLDQLLPQATQTPKVLHESMRYSVFAGGKRLRPILALAAHELAGGIGDAIMLPACALELIHTYSLIHDDLPCMDDDDLRRGMPTNHKVYGEGMAVLAGDALLTLAFEIILMEKPGMRIPASVSRKIAYCVARAAGCLGMVGGQVMDIEGFSRDRQLKTLETTCLMKTGQLIVASLETGALLAETDTATSGSLTQYGINLGLAFQVTDDILNVTGDAKVMGKSVNSDASHDKVTFPELLGVDGSTAYAKECIQKAKSALNSLGQSSWFLLELADYVLSRKS
jgi:geranylgeranyl diphosphate synthase type II